MAVYLRLLLKVSAQRTAAHSEYVVSGYGNSQSGWAEKAYPQFCPAVENVAGRKLQRCNYRRVDNLIQRGAAIRCGIPARFGHGLDQVLDALCETILPEQAVGVQFED